MKRISSLKNQNDDVIQYLYIIIKTKIKNLIYTRTQQHRFNTNSGHVYERLNLIFQTCSIENSSADYRAHCYTLWENLYSII